MLGTEFAKQFLTIRGYEIHGENGLLFEPITNPIYDFSALKTAHLKGQNFIKSKGKKNDIRNIDYEELIDTGYGIGINKNHYILKEIKENTIIKKKCPPDVIIQKNAYLKLVRVIGYNCESVWKSYKKNKSAIKLKYDVINGNIIKEYFKIPELPVMFGDENTLICIPKEHIVPRILIAGNSGYGKSLLLNSLLGSIWYKWNDKMGMINDSQNGFCDLMLPNPDFEIEKLRLINHKPKPLPVVTLYPACKGLKMSNPEVAIKLSVDWGEFLNKYEFFTNGIKDYDLGSPKKYMSTLYKPLLDVKSSAEFKQKMFETLCTDEKSKNSFGSMIMKWSSAFKKLLGEEFTSNVVDDGYSKLELVKNGKSLLYEHPFIVTAMAGLIPIINNYQTNPKHNKLYRNIVADLLQKIVKYQKGLDEDDKKRFWILVDEMNDLYEKKRGVKDNCALSLEELFRQGRVNRLGFIGNTQSYELIDDVIRGNSTHLFVFNLQRQIERKAVKDDYELDKEQTKEIGRMKKFECMLMTKNPIVIYDKWGRRKEKEGGVFKGTIIPPITYHYSPKNKEEE